MGVDVHDGRVRLGLNFAVTPPELFTGQEMGEDATRVLAEYRKLRARISAEVKAEVAHVRAAAARAQRLWRTAS